MHEISLVSSIWKTLKVSLSEAELKSLTHIRLKVGELSTVEPLLLDNAFQAVIQDTQFKNVKLITQTISATAHCATCDEIFTVLKYRFICPKCQTPTSDVRSGEEFLIENVEFASTPTNHLTNHV